MNRILYAIAAFVSLGVDADPAPAPLADPVPDPAPAAPAETAPAPAPAVDPAPPVAPPVPAHPYLGSAVIFVPPINAVHPGPNQVPARITAVHGDADVTVLTEDGDEYRCVLHFSPVEEIGSGLLAVLEERP